jgi:hypothetical protein
MARYDQGYDRGFRPMSLGIPGAGGYARDFAPRRGYDRPFSWAERDAGMWSHGVGTYRQWGTRWEAVPGGAPEAGRARGDRGVYDAAGYPVRGYFGGGGEAPRRIGGAIGSGNRRPSQDRGPGQSGGRGDFARGPFVPEEAYRRHPELSRGGREDEPWDERAYSYYGPGMDGAVARAVRERMLQDSWLDPNGIDVDVRDGVVTLRGEVGDFMEARYAWDDAWETDGVRGVINNLAVRMDAGVHGDPMPQSVHTGRR